MDLGLVVVVTGFLGARLAHVLYEEPSYYAEHPVEVFAVWQGGLVFYGGMLSALGAAWLFCRRRNLEFWQWADLIAPIAALTYAIGRLGCFFNGCCFGRACDYPWGIEFLSHAELGLSVVPRHPTQLYAVVWESCLMLGLLAWERTQKKSRLARVNDQNDTQTGSALGRAPVLRRPFSGQVFLGWLIGHSVGRAVMELFRDDDRGAFWFGLSISTWISAALFGFALWNWVKLQPRPSPSLDSQLRP